MMLTWGELNVLTLKIVTTFVLIQSYYTVDRYAVPILSKPLISIHFITMFIHVGTSWQVTAKYDFNLY